MRILYNNLIDDLAASRMTALTEEALYGPSNVQDQRLTTTWRTTACTDQTIIFSGSCDTIVGGNIGLVTGSAATNLVTDANMTGAFWNLVNGAVVTTAASILGEQAYLVTGGSTASPYVKTDDFAIAAITQCVTMVAKKSTATSGDVQLYDVTSSRSVVRAAVNFSTKTVTYSVGSEAIPAQWVDDYTARVFLKSDGTSVTAHTVFVALYAGGTSVSTIYSMPQVINNTFPVPYVATSRTAVSTSYSHRLPPSGKFILDFEAFPFFPASATNYPAFGGFYYDGNNRAMVYFHGASKQMFFEWKQDGTAYNLNTSTQFDAGTAQTINQTIRAIVSVDISTAGLTTGSCFIVIPRSQGSIQKDTSWSAALPVFSATTLTAFRVGYGISTMDGIFRHARVYGGCFSATTISGISTEADVDAALVGRELLLDQTYQRQFNFDTVAIMGHNISQGAAVKMEANDWNEWNYVDGSGSSIIQHALSWDDETILKMITKTKKQYVKFTINDPNNAAGYLDIGRMWLGEYIDIDPSSLDNFTVQKMRTDEVVYGVNRQKFAAVGTGYRRFNFRFPRTQGTTLAAIQRMYDTVGNHSSVIFCNFDTLRDYELVEPVYCSIVGDISFTHESRQKYNYQLTLEENK